MKTEAEVGVMPLSQRTPKISSKPPEAGREPGQTPWQLPEGSSPAHTLILDSGLQTMKAHTWVVWCFVPAAPGHHHTRSRGDCPRTGWDGH